MLALISLFKLDKEEGGLKDRDRSVFKNIAVRADSILDPRPLARCTEMSIPVAQSSWVTFLLTPQKRFMVGTFDFFSKNTPKTTPKVC